MANITIDVVGNGSGGGGQQSTPQNTTSQNLGDNQRLVEDIRREMQQRGVVYVPNSSDSTKIISQYTQQLQKNGEQQIEDKYASERDRIKADYIEQRRVSNEKYQKRRASIDFDSAEGQEALNRLDIEEEKEWKQITAKYNSDIRNIDAKEKEEKDKFSEDVTTRMQEIIELLKEDSINNPDNPNSYIGNLRKEQRELIRERDSATTREDAISASKRLSAVNAKLREANGEEKDDRYYRDPILQATQGMQGLFSSMENGDVGGMVSNFGSLAVGLSGVSAKTALKAMGWVYALAEVANSSWKSAQRYERVAPLAAYRATSGGLSGENAMMELNSYLTADRKIAGLDGPGGVTGVSWSSLGFDRTSFMEEASSRIRARGTSQDWYDQTIRQLTLEASLALNSGALKEGSRFDRYGTNTTDAITKLVVALNSIGGSGVTPNDFTRVQEKYDIQQQIMQSYLGRTDKPNYDIASSNLAAFSAVRGITQDSRIGSDYAVFQNAIQNPMNDKFRALLYNTVENIPGLEYTRGRPDLIERAITDPENEGKIIQAVVKNVKQIYGGTDTMMGFYAFKNLFPGISPDRLDAYVNEISDSESQTSKLLKKGINGVFEGPNGQSMDSLSAEWQDWYVRDAKAFHSQIITGVRSLSNSVQGIVDYLTGRRGTGDGNNRVRSAAE